MNPDPTSLERLHDIIAPPPVPWWPPAPGWYWVLAFLVVMAVALAIRAFIHWQRNRYRREALAELVRLEATFSDPARGAQPLAAVAELLKRAALTAWPREEVARLNGPEWVLFLERTNGLKSFDAAYGELLESVAYDPRKAHSLDRQNFRDLTRFARLWLAHHRPEGTS